MKTYSTLSGARRASHGGPILRVLDDSTGEEVFIPNLRPNCTTIYSVPRSGTTMADGAIKFFDLFAGHGK